MSWLTTKANTTFNQYFNVSGRAYPDVAAQGMYFHTIIGEWIDFFREPVHLRLLSQQSLPS
jgi:hypothetical protein